MSPDAAKGIVLLSAPPVISLHSSSGSPVLIGLIYVAAIKEVLQGSGLLYV